MSLHQHEIVVLAGLGERALQRLGRAFAVAAIELLVGADHALGRVEQALAVGIVADIGDQRAHRGFGLLARRTVGHRLRRGADMIAEGGVRTLGPGLDDGVHRSLRSTRASAHSRAPDVSPGGRVADAPGRAISTAGAWTSHSQCAWHVHPERAITKPPTKLFWARPDHAIYSRYGPQNNRAPGGRRENRPRKPC